MGSEEFPPFFFRFSSPFFVFLRFFLFFFAFLLFSQRKKGNDCNLLQKGEVHSDPVCTDPVQNFPNYKETSPFLGGHFGPEKKYLAPPPPPKFLADSLPALWETPPGSVKKKNRQHPILSPRSPPCPPPSRKKIKNIRNVHQAFSKETHK